MISNQEIGRQRKSYVAASGLDASLYDVWSHKWKTLCMNARHMDRECKITFEQYIDLAVDAGINDPSQIGRSEGQYQMGRLGDNGGYEIGNCRFITVEQNRIEKKVNGGTYRGCSHRGMSKETHKGLASMVETRMGWNKKTHTGIASQALKLSKEYRIVSPNGIIYTGRNISEFCAEHNLCKVSMAAVCRGSQKTHKGWTGTYV